MSSDSKKEDNSSQTPEEQRHAAVRNKWKTFALKARAASEEGEKYTTTTSKAERAKRLLWDPTDNSWKEDIVMVKIEEKPFDKGAQRECFKALLISGEEYLHSFDWHMASKCVAKKYMKAEECTRENYENDVKMQILAKHYGELYSKANPPKKVDFMQTFLVEMTDREQPIVFCFENFLEGNYQKHNNNSGYVSDTHRMTPHAFSHFTFEKSKQSLIIVDIQGVSDLYTDPQIHTINETGFGTGNLGKKGMALFFHSHQCNGICKLLNLSKFTRYHKSVHKSHATMFTESSLSDSFKHISLNQTLKLSKPLSLSRSVSIAELNNLKPIDIQCLPNEPTPFGKIHYQLAKFYESGRLSEDEQTPDTNACLFHLQWAAQANILCAQLALARLYSGFSGSLIPEKEDENYELCYLYLKAAIKGNKNLYAMYHCAQMAAEGRGTTKNIKEAVEYTQTVYDEVIAGNLPKEKDDTGGDIDYYDWHLDFQPYLLLQSLGDYHCLNEGKWKADYAKAAEHYRDAAEAAMEAMKGKLSMKLYMKADEVEAMAE